MAKHGKSGKKKGKGKKAQRAAATDANALRSSEPTRAETGSSLPRMGPPAMLLALGAIIAGGATALLRLRR